jgi:uncharacterized membrane protein (DUF4010 family)
MNAVVVLFGLMGIGFCTYMVYRAWQGKAGIPFGTIFGGALGGMPGAMVGALTDDHEEKKRARPNIAGLIFWSICGLAWIGITVSGFVSE